LSVIVVQIITLVEVHDGGDVSNANPSSRSQLFSISAAERLPLALAVIGNVAARIKASVSSFIVSSLAPVTNSGAPANL
jgi:hypothetical protein